MLCAAKNDEGVYRLHSLTSRQHHQRVDVQLGQVAFEVHGEVRDAHQGILERLEVGNQLEAEYRGSRQREVLLQQALAQQKNDTAAMADKMVQYNILKREAEANKQLYDGLLQKLKEAGISAGLRSSNIRIVDPALVPTAPSRPNKSRNITLAILVGLVGGVGLALLREYLDNTVKNPDDVETLSRLPSLAVVPAFTGPTGLAGTGCRSSCTAPVMDITKGWRCFLTPSPNRRFRKPSAPCARRSCFRRPIILRGDPGNERPAS